MLIGLASSAGLMLLQMPFAAPAQGQAAAPSTATSPAASPPPNVAIILLDDAGFAATSLFGGLAQTPAFEALARDGARYDRFHVAAICAPTRAALLSGRNPHQVGFGTVPEIAMDHPGYNSIWPKTATPLAEHLRRLGYGTAAFGKWHNTPAWEWSPAGPFDRWPTGLGFDYFYGTLGTTSSWEPLLWRGTTAVQPSRTAEQGYNLTADLVDDAVTWLHTRQSLVPDKPYFLYFATTATHSPHQVAEGWVRPYRGKFDRGWDALRPAILDRQKAMGIVPRDARLTPRPAGLPAWASLSADQRAVAARQMEILAGFMSQTDHEVGRLIDAVRQGPRGKDTLIMLIAGDNGSSGDDGLYGCDDCPLPPPPPRERLTYLRDLAGPGHSAESAAGWAFMNDTPFAGMKRQASHLGGVRVPLVLSWPGHVMRPDIVRSQWIDVTDVAATLYDVLGVKPPRVVDGVEQLPMAGTPFTASLANPAALSTHRVQYFETFGSRAIYRDGWMASLRYLTPWSLKPVFERGGPDKGADRWELYDLTTDYSQARDLAGKRPDVLRGMVTLFDAEARANKVYPLGMSFADNATLPSLSRHRTEFVFHADVPILAWDALPDFRRAHRITVRADFPARADGLLVSSGSRGRGFALYMKDGYLTYESEQVLRASTLTTPVALSEGRHEVVLDLSAAPTEYGGTGVRHVRIAVDGRVVAQGNVPDEIAAFYGAATLSVGAERVAPVSPRRPPRFTGTIDKIVVRYLSSAQ